VTAVYGPQGEQEKISFLQELRQLKQVTNHEWLLIRDFNLILRASDKSNDRVNTRMINRFRALVDDLEVKAIHLHGLKFTWSSGTANPTQTKIDHILVTWEWELTHADAHMQAMSSPCLTIAHYYSPARLSTTSTRGSASRLGGSKCRA
jgi:hypothetical protein